MSFRGSYQNPFRRAYYSDRGRPMKKHYGFLRDNPFRNHRGGSKDYFERRDSGQEHKLDRGRGRGRSYNRFYAENNQHFRGRFPNRGQNYRGCLNKNVESPSCFKNDADNLEDYLSEKASVKLGTEQSVKINPNENPRNLIIPGEDKHEHPNQNLRNLTIKEEAKHERPNQNPIILTVVGEAKHERPNQNMTNLVFPGEDKHGQNNISQGETFHKYQPSTNAIDRIDPHNSSKESITLSVRNASQNKKPMLNVNIDIKKYLGLTLRPGYLSELKDVIVISDDESEDEDNKHLEQIFPDDEFINRYSENPAPHEELTKFFNEFVIYFGVRHDSNLEKDPFNVIQESFNSSLRYGSLDVEEMTENQGFLPVPKQVCVLRWRGAMLAKGSDYSLEKARQKAAKTLINNLAHSCYTIQAKYSYYCGGKLPKSMLKVKEKPGEYKIISKKEMTTAVTSTLEALWNKRVAHLYCGKQGVDATHIWVVINFIDEFFKNQRRHCELIFGGKTMEYTKGELDQVARHVNIKPWLQWRSIQGYGRGIYTAVSRRFTPQQLFNHLMEAKGETMRYKVLPPQPPWIDLLIDECQYSPNITKTLPNISSSQDESNAPLKRSYSGNFSGGKRGKWV